MTPASLILLLATGTPAQAEGYCSPAGTVVHYANGMSNTYASARAGLSELSSVMKPQLEQQDPDSSVRFELRYNDYELAGGQLDEVVAQFTTSTAASFLRWMAGGEPGSTDELFMSIYSDLIEFLPYPTDEDLAEHVSRYRQLHLEGNRQLVVAHSQGTLYSNAAYRAAGIGDGSMGMVFVGSPASEVASDGLWVENVDDPVGFLGALPANSENTDKSKDFWQHNFLDAYLYGDAAGPMLQSAIRTTVSALSTPVMETGSGAITVSLGWGDEPDLDLHVIEPDGTHVYYGNPLGTSGALDRDDTDGHGPEHYTVPCEDLMEGTYTVAVNYYYGSGPEVARTTVAAGYEVGSYTTTLTSAAGGSGDMSPTAIADIMVFQDPDTKRWSFELADGEWDL